ncbi:MAG: DUF6502 family protein [Pseudomonadota bacterium]
MKGTDSGEMLQVLKGLLRPLVRLLISRGVSAPALYRVLKSVYVEVAHKDFRIDDMPPTDSRVSMITGVHRRDVKSILSDEDESWESARSKTVTFATVLGQWIARPDYQDENGRPRPLLRTGEDGVDFESLVQDVSRDIRPRTILDELFRQGLVTEGEDGLLSVNEGALAGPASEEHKMVFFATNVGDHLAAATENLLSEEPPYFERAVFYSHLSPTSVDAIEARAREMAQSLLEDLNSESSALQVEDKESSGQKERYRFGVYFYREGSGGSEQVKARDEESD